MSHFTTIKTRWAEKEPLLQALRDLGYFPVEGPVEIRGYEEGRRRVEIKIASPNPEYDIGFQKKDGCYECVADWYGLRDFDQTKFVNELTRRYAYHAARSKLEAQGFTLAAEEVAADGRVHLVLRRIHSGHGTAGN